MAFPIRREIQYGHVCCLYRADAQILQRPQDPSVVDNAPWHKTKALRKWLGEITHLIEVHFLPKYSLKLNAAEHLWEETRKWAGHNRFFETLKDLKQSLSRRFNRFQGSTGAPRSIVPYFPSTLMSVPATIK